MFRSFWMGGFEGADHVNGDGTPLDMVDMTAHASRADEDYRRAARLGLRTVRESIGWRLSENGAGDIDLTRAIRMAETARANGVQVLWTLMHYGIPSDLSLLDDRLIGRFARFAGHVARTLAPLSAEAPIYTPINEISFLAWAACETPMMGPAGVLDLAEGSDRGALGYAVKRRLARAALAGIAAMRAADPRARIMHVEPVVHVVAPPDRPDLADEAVRMAGYQWQALDLLAGLIEPELGGSAMAIDCIGVNHYHNSQWELGCDGGPSRALEWHLRDERRLGLAQMLGAAWARYGRPLIVGETGHIGVGRAAWLHETAGEVRHARASGVPVQGICLYPLLDRPDWNDLAHWHRSGLWHVSDLGSRLHSRALNRPYAEALAAWRDVFHRSPAGTAKPCLMVLLARGDAVAAAFKPLLEPLGVKFDLVVIELGASSTALAPRRYALGPNMALHVLPVDAAQDPAPGWAPGSIEQCLRTLMEGSVAARWFVWAECPEGLELARCLPFVARIGHSEVPCVRTYSGGGVVPGAYEAGEARVLLATVPRGDIAGVIAGTHHDIDVDLLASLALLRPELQIVVFAPILATRAPAEPAPPNLHWLPAPPPELVQALLSRFGVCLVPSSEIAMPDCHRSRHRAMQRATARKTAVALPDRDQADICGAVCAAHRVAKACDAALAARRPPKRSGAAEERQRRRRLAAAHRSERELG